MTRSWLGIVLKRTIRSDGAVALATAVQTSSHSGGRRTAHSGHSVQKLVAVGLGRALYRSLSQRLSETRMEQPSKWHCKSRLLPACKAQQG